jgi:hypothetical protein
MQPNKDQRLLIIDLISLFQMSACQDQVSNHVQWQFATEAPGRRPAKRPS